MSKSELRVWLGLIVFLLVVTGGMVLNAQRQLASTASMVASTLRITTEAGQVSIDNARILNELRNR